MEKQVKRLSEVAKREANNVLRCAQCGEHLDVQRIRQVAQGERMMCADCAFDSIPCTD